MDISEVFRKRYELLSKLDKISPITIQAQNKSMWTSYFSIDDLLNKHHYYAPSLHYKILPCEIVIEVGSNDPDNLEHLFDCLKNLKINATFGFSGKRSWHIHFFIKPEKANLHEFSEHREARLFTLSVFNLLVKHLRHDGVSAIDVQPMFHGRIRSFYSQHPETYNFKMPINLQEGAIPYPIWSVGRIWYKLFRKKQNISFDAENDAIIAKAIEVLSSLKKRETSEYIYYTCPFHQPDKNPSFTFNKKKKIFTDWHENRVYTAQEILKKLNIQ